jgi:glycosyltransferase involved in cell wall biosynthesis
MNFSLSVVIPFYNSLFYLKKNFHFINNLKNIPRLEILFIDDCSLDKSSNWLVKNFSSSNVRFYKTKKNSGPGIARNIGLAKANGKKVLFLDSDDSLSIKNLKLLLKYNENKNFNILNFGKKHLNSSKKQTIVIANLRLLKNIKRFFLETAEKEVLGFLFDINFLKRNRIFFKKGIFEDILFLFKILFYNKKKIIFFKKIIYLKSSNKNSITNNFSLQHTKFMLRAWLDIVIFLRRKIKNKYFQNLDKHIQYRLRGLMYDDYKKIQQFFLKKKNKDFMIVALVKIYKKILNKNYTCLTSKDHVVKNLINNYSY